MSIRYGYGHSKPQVNYHQQNTEYVTTVIKEMSRMTVNQKPSYGGGGVGDVQKDKVCKEGQVIEEKNCGYNNGYHGGDNAVQKHEYKHEAFEEKKSGYNNGYKHEAAFEEKGSSYNGYHGGGGAVQKHAYKEEAFQEKTDGYSGYHGGGGAVKQKHEYHQEEEVFDGPCIDGGYSGHHGGAGAAVKNKHGYQHGAYGDAAGYAASHLGGGDMQKYGYQKEIYGTKADAGGYGYGGHYGGCGANKHKDSYKQQAAYGGGAITGAVQQHAYYQDAYDQADAAAYGGAYYGGGAIQAYDASYKHKAGYGAAHGGAMQKHGYKQEMYSKTAGAYHGGAAGGAYNHYNMAHGHAAKTEFAGGHHHHHHGATYESESDCEESDYESDCEEAAFGHHQQGGAHLGGGVCRYESYERHENLGGGHRYESYQTATHEGYTAGGAGYGACAQPRKNRFFF